MTYDRYKPPNTRRPILHGGGGTGTSSTVAPPGLKAINGVAEPPDVEISHAPLAGTLQRATTIAHLHRMHEDGYLSDQQLKARHQAAEHASTQQMLAELIADLPNLRPIIPPFSWGNRAWYTPILLGTTAVSAMVVLIPALTISAPGGHISTIGVTVIAVTMIIGIIGLLTSLVMLGCKLADDGC